MLSCFQRESASSESHAWNSWLIRDTKGVDTTRPICRRGPWFGSVECGMYGQCQSRRIIKKKFPTLILLSQACSSNSFAQLENDYFRSLNPHRISVLLQKIPYPAQFSAILQWPAGSDLYCPISKSWDLSDHRTSWEHQVIVGCSQFFAFLSDLSAHTQCLHSRTHKRENTLFRLVKLGPFPPFSSVYLRDVGDKTHTIPSNCFAKKRQTGIDLSKNTHENEERMSAHLRHLTYRHQQSTPLTSLAPSSSFPWGLKVM